MNKIAQDSHFPRKLYHMVAASVIPTIYLLEPAPRQWIVWLTCVAAILWFIFDNVRIRVDSVNQFFQASFRFLMKTKETGQLLGMTYVLIGAALCLLLFDPMVATASLYFAAIGDPFAAVVGKGIGKVKIIHGRTIEGSVAMFLVCLALGFALTGPGVVAGAGALAATFAELYTNFLDDNLTVPVAAGVAMTLTGLIF